MLKGIGETLLTIAALLVALSHPAWAQALRASVLPSSRSVQVGTPANAFATIINVGQATAIGCGLSLTTSLPATFRFQTTDPVTNKLTGTLNTPVDIPAGAAQSFVFAFIPTRPIDPTEVALNFVCTNTAPAPIISGVNTLLLSASTTPIPDIVALAVTPSKDGILNIPGTFGRGVFAVAAVNVGVGGTITVSADPGEASPRVFFTLCETDPATGKCLATSPQSTSVTTQINANATPTFGIFVSANGVVPFLPATNRIFVRFTDLDGVPRGSTSVAVRTQLPDIRGTYAGRGTYSQRNCQNPPNNAVLINFGESSTSISVPNQVGEGFSGSATLTGRDIKVTINIIFSGTVNVLGQLRGTFTFTTLTDGGFAGSGDGSFTGSLFLTNFLNLGFSGQMRVGEVCTLTASLSGTQ